MNWQDLLKNFLGSNIPQLLQNAQAGSNLPQTRFSGPTGYYGLLAGSLAGANPMPQTPPFNPNGHMQIPQVPTDRMQIQGLLGGM